MTNSDPSATPSETEPIDEMTNDELRLLVQRLEAESAAMRPIALRVAEARMCRDAVTMVESCPHCSLRRSATLGYGSAYDENCVVSQARRLGF